MDCPIRIYGASWCPDRRRAKRFLGDQRVPFEWHDIEQDPDGVGIVQARNNGNNVIPTIIFPDDSHLAEPSNEELANKLGLERSAMMHVYDLIVVGGGPAGLTTSIYAGRENLQTLIVDSKGLGGQARSFVYSKLMCWVALDRGIRLAPLLGCEERVGDWTATRERIRAAIWERGWSERVQAFAQSFGSDELDASVLMMPIVGFLPADDPRMLSTIDAIEQRLTDERGLVYRHLAEDGLPGEEGTFLLCTFWLAQAQAMAGLVDRARATFDCAIAHVNDVGLLSEEVDARTGELLGNFPQAFSHIGLVNAAAAIAAAERSAVSA